MTNYVKMHQQYPRNRDRMCVYCGGNTPSKQNIEHEIPESLGNKKFLMYDGSVCSRCNHTLGHQVDGKILQDPGFALAQIQLQITGKKNKTRQKIQHKKSLIEKNANKTTVQDAIFGKPHEKTSSRALAKCAVNILAQEFGSISTRQNFRSLIDYVNQPKANRGSINSNDIWPYYGFYTVIQHIVDRKIILFESTEPSISNAAGVFIICASGMFGVPLDRRSEKHIDSVMMYVNSTTTKYAKELTGFSYTYLCENQEF